MKKTKFNRKLWNLTQFDEIGYDKDKKSLFIYLLNGEIIEFQKVEENHVFELIISSNKEQLINQSYMNLYPYSVYSTETSNTI